MSIKAPVIMVPFLRDTERGGAASPVVPYLLVGAHAVRVSCVPQLASCDAHTSSSMKQSQGWLSPPVTGLLTVI